MSVHFELDNNFFAEEQRSGFTVPELMKRCWGAQLKVLEEFDRVCEKHGLKWFAYCGTLLGSVRHKGFIPWDDDMDVAMLRDDYEKFLQIAPSEFPVGYAIINYDEGDHEYDCITRVNNTRTIIFEEEKLAQFCSFPYPAGLDVYPLDYIVEDSEEREAHKQLHYKIKQATELCRKILAGAGPLTDKDGNRLEPSQLLAEISVVTGYEFDLEKDIIRQLNILIDMTDSMNSEEDGKYIGNIGHITFEGDRMMFPKECFERLLTVPFETGYVYIPVGYDTLLRQNYGARYMIPVIHSPHEYPYYASHQKVMRKFLERHPDAVSDEWIRKYL